MTFDTMLYRHVTAMPMESVHFLNCKPGKVIVDGTLGGFGHSRLICDRIGPNGTLIGIDQDIDAIKNAKKIIKNELLKIHVLHGDFAGLPELLKQIRIPLVDGILIDTGVSQYQIQASGRGFSFMRDEPLDMRMNAEIKTTAAIMLATLSEKEIADVFRKYGEERWAKRIAHHLVKVRNVSPIKTSGQLSYLVEEAVPRGYAKNRKIHPATRVFMALRIAVNKELEKLDQFLKTVMNLLNPEGRLCILSFHSLEDRIVKNAFKAFENPCTCPPDFPICACNRTPVARLITRKVVRPSQEEVEKNSMARSTRLRVVEKI